MDYIYFKCSKDYRIYYYKIMITHNLTKPCLFLLLLLSSACSMIGSNSTLEDSSFVIGETLGAKGLVAITGTSSSGNQIYLLDLDKKVVSEFITEPGNNAYPAFSPDGSQLIFVSNRSGRSEVYLALADGSDPEQVTFNESEKFYPFWSPDGQTIYFTQAPSSTKSNIFAISMSDIKNKKYSARNVTKHSGRNTAGNISSDGQSLAFTTDRSFPGWEICILNLLDSTENCLLNKKPDTFCKPKWANTTNTFAYSFGYNTQIDLGLYNPATQSSSQLTHLTDKSYEPAWSNDDKYMIFSNDPASSNTERYGLKIMRFADNQIADLLQSQDLSLEYISWKDSNSTNLSAH